MPTAARMASKKQPAERVNDIETPAVLRKKSIQC